MKTIAFYINPHEGWIGGLNYYKNLFSAISLIKENEFNYILFLPTQSKKFQFENFFKWKIIYDDNFLTNFELTLIEYTKKYNINILSHMNIRENIYNCKICNWIPDFQHLHLPQFFSKEEIELRNSAFIKYANISDIIFVSSIAAKNDFSDFIPQHKEKAKILNFVTNINLNFLLKIKELIPVDIVNKDYFFMPNQFWQHKNHITVFKAIKELKNKNIHINLICTGHKEDYRNKKYFNFLQDFISTNNLEKNITLLGIVPQDTLYALMFLSRAVINPSLFEGWSSTVEECKILKKFILLSDIPVHKEQINNFNINHAKFFNPLDYQSLADNLEILIKEKTKSQAFNKKEMTKTLFNKMLEFGLNYEKIVKENII